MANAVCGCVAQAYINDVHTTQRKHFAAKQATDNGAGKTVHGAAEHFFGKP